MWADDGDGCLDDNKRRIINTHNRFRDVGTQIFHRIQQQVEPRLHISVCERSRMEACQKTRDEFSFPWVLVQTNRNGLFDHIGMVLFALQFLEGANYFICIARFEIFIYDRFHLQFKFWLSQHGTIHSLFLRRIKVFGFWVFMAGKHIVGLGLIIVRVVFIHGSWRSFRVKIVVLPFPLSVTSLLLVSRIKVSSVAAVSLFSGNVPLGATFFYTFGFMFVSG